MNLNNINVLLRHNYVPLHTGNGKADVSSLATVMMNLSYYGYALSAEAYQTLATLTNPELASWWGEIEAELKKITGEDRKIGDFVVYKNFPAEVLEKSEAEYWFAQLLMYWGCPNEFFTQDVKPREKMDEQPRLTVLKLAKKDTPANILNSYLSSPARWKDEEFADVSFLSEKLPVNFGLLTFKENLVRLASHFMVNGRQANMVMTATDVLRLAAGLSDGDVSLREKTKFISFKKPWRKCLLLVLESCRNLAEDVARRPEVWKRLLHQLHPGDYKRQCPNVCKVMNDLYNDQLTTFNSEIEKLLLNKDSKVLGLLSERPGEFRRRLVHTLDLFGDKTLEAFTKQAVLDKLSTYQVVSLRSHFDTLNKRSHRTFPPKGNWNKLQLGEPRYVYGKHAKAISDCLGKVLSDRMPKIKVLDKATQMIKLPNNGEVSPYARGTVFPVPSEVEFIRTASFWKKKANEGNIWFDNGWNFFDSNWKSLGACCWNAVKFRNDAAVFSGDPTNSKEMKGRAAQLIDLYPSKLRNEGVRYAVWNILCFSHIEFADADDVFAALQWGKDPQKGNLFEPSRCQLSFQLSGKQLTKYICLLDLEKNEMTYLDANLKGQVSSANSNGNVLEKSMPAFMEYINSLPSVYDLFRESVDKNSSSELHVLYSDKDVELNGVQAYVFRHENENNKFKAMNLNDFLI